jgi:hypothetical protein
MVFGGEVMSVGQIIESVQNLPDNEFLILRQAVLEQESKRHLQFKPEQQVIHMDLREYLPEPAQPTPEELEFLRP